MSRGTDLAGRRSKLSPEEQALLDEWSQGAPPPLAVSELIHRRRQDRAPLSFAQERLWFLDQLEPNNPAYNVARAVRLSGMLKPSALEQSLLEIQRRHEALRTRFVTVHGQAVQVVAPAPSLKKAERSIEDLALPVIDLRSLPEDERESEAQRLANKEARQPFDLAQGPLLRTTLLWLAEDEYILLLTMHHIISDGWSMGVLFRELSALYQAFSAGESSSLPELPIQYADYALWQRGWLQGEVLDRQLSYWRQQLDGAPPNLELPFDRPRPPVQTYRGGRHSLDLPKDVTQALKAIGQREGATLFMTLLAAFKTLAYRLTGQDDVVVGTPIAGRNRSETESLIGFFLNNLVLRTDLSGQPTFLELLHRVRETALAAYDQQDIPFEKLLEELQPERELGRTPFFQILFNMLPAQQTSLALQGLSSSDFPKEGTLANFDLTVYVSDQGESIRVSFVYNADLFGQTTIEGMLTHYQNLLAQIAAHPERRISDLKLLTEADVRWLASRSNTIHPTNHFSEFGTEEIEGTIVERFEKQVKTHGTAVAVKTRNYEWTYEKLNRRANRVARAILAKSGESLERVGLMFEHDAPMLAAMLGSLKAGKTYVPLDPHFPQERLAYILTDSMAGAIVANNGTMALAQKLHKGAVIDIFNIDELNEAAVGDDLNLSVSPDRMAYILYTSGTTGEPKGVMQNHRNVLHHIRVYTNNLHIGSEDRLTLLSTYGFDAAVMDVFGALLNGARLYPLNLRREEAASIGQWLKENEISVYHSTPTVFRHFMRMLAPGERLEGVRLVVLGGEQVYREDFERYKGHFAPGSILVNGFGPTESTLSMQFFLNHNTPIERTAIPIGYAVENTDIMLVNEAGENVEVFGEIAIRSPHIALGYWQKPEITEAVFLPDPEGGRNLVYRTADMGRLLPNGEIEFIGRKDTQVKIRGFRVELGEIEAELVKHPSVKEAAAIVHEDRSGEERIAAFLVAEHGNVPGTMEILRYLGRRLPDYMLPASIQYMQELPITQTGKLDRRVLGALDVVRPALETGFIAPRTPTEVALADIWTEVLGVEQVGVQDNFFELGGHSLLAVRLFALINKTLGVTLPLATLFRAPTVENLGAVLDEHDAPEATAWSSLVPMQPTGTNPPLFVVPGNLGNVYVDLGHLARYMGPDQPFYGLQDWTRNPVRIQVLASQYLDEIQSVQPQGPYLLAGVCSGAVVALEMAQQIQAQGQEVALLAMVEPSPPQGSSLSTYARFAASMLRRFRQRSGHHASSMAQQGPTGLSEYLRLKLKVVANSWAVRRYVPQPYSGRIDLFLTQGSLRSSDSPQLRWRECALGGSDVHQIPGSHATITGLDDTRIENAHMQVLAEQLGGCIDSRVPTE